MTTFRRVQMKQLSLAVAAALVSGGFSAMAMAQAAAPAPAASAGNADKAEKTEKTDKKSQLETILVTAQKRSEDAQKTPLAITSLNGEDIAESGIKNARDLNGVVPNVVVNINATATEFTIRGITSTNNTELGNPAVGFHLDGVYLARPDAAGAAFFDVDRIEVLRGPQGTLWGRNVTAGAINVITNKPKNKFESAVMLEIGNYNSQRSEVMINLPFTDVFAMRAALTTEKRDGYNDSTNPLVGATKKGDDANSLAARLHALFTPNKDFSLLVTADKMKVGGAGYASVPLPLVAKTGAAGRIYPATQQQRLDNKYDGLSAEANWAFGNMAATYIVARRTSTRDETNYSAPNSARSQLYLSPTQVTHELRLASTGNGPLTWVVGAYDFDEKNGGTLVADNVNGIPGLPPTLRVQLAFLQPDVKGKARAYFGQSSFAVNDKLKLTAGLRSTRDSLSLLGRNTTTVTLPNGTPVAPTSTLQNKSAVESSKVNWRLGADYSMDKNVMFYATAATGYKAGGFFDGTRTETFDNAFKPENVATVEFGLKSRALNNSLQTNVALFRNDYKDLQVSFRGPSPSGVVGSFITLTQNAAKARINGLEIESRWFVPIGRFDASLAFLDAKYQEFDPPNASPRINNTGNRLTKSPRVSGNIGYQYSWDLAGADLALRAGMFFTQKYFLQPTNIELTSQPAYRRSDLSLTYTARSSAWYTQLYAKNLENNNIIAGLGGITAPNTFLAPPRTYGLRAGIKF